MKKTIIAVFPYIIICLLIIWMVAPQSESIMAKFESISSHFKFDDVNKRQTGDSSDDMPAGNSAPALQSQDEDNTVGPDIDNSDNLGDDFGAAGTVYRIAKQYNGKIGIFLPNTPLVPEFILDVNISKLPPMDKKMFEQGLVLSTKEQLTNLIEDYTS